MTALFKLKTGSRVIDSFANISVSTLVSITLYSIVTTNGITISWGYLILIAVNMIYRNAKEEVANSGVIKKTDYDTSKQIYIEISLVASAIFMLKAFSISDYSGHFFLFPSDPDRALFADITNFIKNTGVESQNINYIDPSASGRTPYHYFELWLTGLISFLYSTNTLQTDHLLVSPLIGTVIYNGFRALSEALQIRSYFAMLASFTASVLNFEVQIPWFNQFPLLERTATYFQLSAADYAKFFPIYLFQIGSILFILYRRNFQALVSVLFLPIANILLAPQILLSSAAITLVEFIKKKTSRREFILSGALILLITCFLIIFYSLFAAIKLHAPPGNFELVKEAYLRILFSRTSINIIVGSCIQLFYMLLPWALLTLFFRDKVSSYLLFNQRVLEVFYKQSLVLFAGLICWVALSGHPESTQLYVRYAHVYVNIIAFILICIIFKHHRSCAIYILIFILIAKVNYQYDKIRVSHEMAKSAYSREFLIAAGTALKGLNPKGVVISAESGLKSVRAKTVAMRPGYFTAYIDSELYPTNISNFNEVMSINPFSQYIEANLVNSQPFYKFMKMQEMTGVFESVSQSQYKFIVENHIDYMILGSFAKVPKKLCHLIAKVYHDSMSNESLVILGSVKEGFVPDELCDRSM